RPDLVGRPVNSWADLLSPEFKGKAALQDQPTVGVIDVAMALEARGDIKYGNKGNMTKAEIDKTIDTMIAIKKSGHFRSFWTSFDQSVNLMASDEVVIQSMWSPAVAAVKARGIPVVYQPLREGFRGWGYTLAPMKHLAGLKLDCFYEYMNWYTSGFQGAFIARQGYYSSVPRNSSARRNGITGTAGSRPRPISPTRTASWWRKPATPATAAPSGIAWATSRCGIR